jgi:hypothetical protein
MGAPAAMVVARAVSRAQVKKCTSQGRASHPTTGLADLSNVLFGEAGHPLANDQGEHHESENHV